MAFSFLALGQITAYILPDANQKISTPVYTTANNTKAMKTKNYYPIEPNHIKHLFLFYGLSLA